MSKDVKYRIRLTYPNCALCSDIWVDSIEYKDMLKSLRMFDEPKNVWLQDIKGAIHNMSLVQAFQVIETQEYI